MLATLMFFIYKAFKLTKHTILTKKIRNCLEIKLILLYNTINLCDLVAKCETNDRSIVFSLADDLLLFKNCLIVCIRFSKSSFHLKFLVSLADRTSYLHQIYLTISTEIFIVNFSNFEKYSAVPLISFVLKSLFKASYISCRNSAHNQFQNLTIYSLT